MARLDNKIALVTGGASVPGLGSATARRFAREGAHVHVTDLDGAGAEQLAAAIRAEGGSALAMPHDVTNDADWDRVMTWILDTHGQLDVVVNNAGVAVLRPLEDLTMADFRLQNEVNLEGVFNGTCRAVETMRASGQGGSIVNISSVAGLVGVRTCAAYAASKGGVRAFSKSAALECAHEGIRINTVHPGMIATNMLGTVQGHDAHSHAATLAGVPMGRLGEPDDIASMNLFLASDEARYITGAEFVVDGGMTAH